MRKMLLITAIAALAPQAATAHVVRHGSIPEAYWGTWAPGQVDCKDEKSIIVLSAKAYVGPAGSCAVESVSETPGPNGAIYSARLQCPGSAGQAKKSKVVNLMFRSSDAGQMSLGPSFKSLAAHRRCSAGSPAAKQQ